MCINETLRIDPPVKLGIYMDILEDTTINNVTFKKGLEGWLNIYDVHHDINQWGEPDKFVPERFDPESKWFLTPGGKKRNPFAYVPFNGGRRVCLGKTFAETQIRIAIPMLLTYFKFDLTEELIGVRKPINDTNTIGVIKLKVTKIKDIRKEM
jgi:cytochrome P450